MQFREFNDTSYAINIEVGRENTRKMVVPVRHMVFGLDPPKIFKESLNCMTNVLGNVTEDKRADAPLAIK